LSARATKTRLGRDISGRKKYGLSDNHAAGRPGKIALRQEALAAIGADRARVLDLFAGLGEMHRAVWCGAAGYRGADKDLAKAMSHPAPTYHAPAADVLASVDLAQFNVFDFDAYGSPWSEMASLFRRRRLAPGEAVAIVLTDGSPRRAMLGHTAKALARLAGVDTAAAGAHTRWPELGRAALERGAAMMGGRLTRLRHPGGPGGRGVWYAWALIEADQAAA
jgi:hypothetical protein